MTLLALLLGCVIVICLAIIFVLMCVVHEQKDEMELMQKPLTPPVKSWVDAYFEEQ